MANIPSIAMIPSAYKSGKVYSVLPSDGSGDLNFTRASEATRVNKDGLIETVGSNVPRIDYKDGGCPSLLLEPQSTNLITHSEDFSDASFSKSCTTIVSDSITSPKGDVTADKIVESTSTNLHIVTRPTTPVLNTTYTFSVYAKKGERTLLNLSSGGSALTGVGGSGAGLLTIFDLDNGVITINNNNGTIENLDNGWYRCSINLSTDNDGGSFIPYYGLIQSGTTENYTGDGVSGLYIWGAQLEQQSYATSYIPTSGATATRNAETSNKANISNLINSSEGVLYLETKPITDNYSNNGSAFSSQINLSDGNLNNGVNIRFRGTSLQCLYYNGSSYEAVLDLTGISIQNYKIAFLYKANEFKMYVNGVLISSDISGSIGSFTLDRLTFDNSNGVNPFYGKIKDLRVYNTVLTDQELIALTS